MKKFFKQLLILALFTISVCMLLICISGCDRNDTEETNDIGTTYYSGNSADDKLIDFNNINKDKNRLIYCYYDLRKINFIQNDKMCFNLNELKHFSSENDSLYGVILERNLFENRVIEYLREYDIGCTIANINYTDKEVDPHLVLQAQQGQSDLAYFQKSQKYTGQQERRIILDTHLDELIRAKAAKKYKDGCKINIGDISSFGHLCKLVNFPI